MKVTLKAARVNAGYTQKSASQRLGVNRLTLRNWEQGRTYPTISKFDEMCRLYNTSWDDIFLPVNSNKMEAEVDKDGADADSSPDSSDAQRE